MLKHTPAPIQDDTAPSIILWRSENGNGGYRLLRGPEGTAIAQVLVDASDHDDSDIRVWENIDLDEMEYREAKKDQIIDYLVADLAATSKILASIAESVTRLKEQT